MSTTARLGGFVLGLAAIAGGAITLGAAIGPVQTQTVSHNGGHREPATPAAPATPELPGGLTVSQDGYSLHVLDDRIAQAGETVLRFRVTDGAGAAVTAYEKSHGKELHLIAVRRDLTEFQHVHPVRSDDGTWAVYLDLSAPGEYRVFADFVPAGAERGYTLGHDVSVAGRYDPEPLPPATRTAFVDGYEVRLVGDLVAGESSRVTLSVASGGAPVTDLQPYLGAYGHLVALRDHDLAYLHVHPDGVAADGHTEAGPEIAFDVEVPSAGDFRLFLDFRHGGQVRTAAFTVSASQARRVQPSPVESAGADDAHGDANHEAPH